MRTSVRLRPGEAGAARGCDTPAFFTLAPVGGVVVVAGGSTEGSATPASLAY